MGISLDFSTVIVRYGELSLKSRPVRARFEKMLLRNLENALHQKRVKFKLRQEYGRIFIETSEPTQAAEIAAKVFGIVSLSPAIVTKADLPEITEVASELGDSILQEDESFAVRARRAGTHAFTSLDVAKAVGAKVLEKTKQKNTKVDLKNPNKEVFVEVRQTRAYVYHQALNGPGGLPLGSQGKLVSLVSGNADCLIATWLMMKRGCITVPIHFNNQPFVNKEARNQAIEGVRKLGEWVLGTDFCMYIVPFDEVLKTIFEKAERDLICILCKRTMYRVAQEIAKLEKATGIINGESFDKFTTFPNIFLLDKAVDCPVFRPLIGLDKIEIEKIAKQIDIYETLMKPVFSCSAASPCPETAELSAIEAAEKELEIQKLLDIAVERAEKIKAG